MHKISDVRLKQLMTEVLLYQDKRVNAQGKRNVRNDIELIKYPIYRSILEKFTPTMEIGYIKKDLKDKPKANEIIWVAIGGSIEGDVKDNYIPFTERHTTVEIEFDEYQIELFKTFFEQRTNDIKDFEEYNPLKEWLYGKVEENK